MIDPGDISPERLKLELAKSGRSQAALARHLGVDQSTVNRLVNGKREIKARELRAIAEYLEISDVSKVSPEDHAAVAKITEKGAQRIMGATRSALDKPVREFALEAWAAVFVSLRERLDGLIPITPPEDLRRFWDIALANPQVLIHLAVGANVIPPRLATVLQGLVVLGNKAGELETLEYEVDPEVIAAIRAFLDLADGDELPQGRALRTKLAVHSATISMLIAGDADGALRGIRELLDTLAPIAERMAK